METSSILWFVLSWAIISVEIEWVWEMFFLFHLDTISYIYYRLLWYVGTYSSLINSNWFFYLSESNFCIEVDEVPYNLSELLLKKNTGKKYRRVYWYHPKLIKTILSINHIAKNIANNCIATSIAISGVPFKSSSSGIKHLIPFNTRIIGINPINKYFYSFM